MRDLRDLCVLLLGFMPWLLFLLISGHTLASLERAVVICLAASLTFGFVELRRGYILQWGTLIFFLACLVMVNLLNVVWGATHMDLLANSALALVMWLTLAVGRPFALQYARSELPKERWDAPPRQGMPPHHARVGVPDDSGHPGDRRPQVLYHRPV